MRPKFLLTLLLVAIFTFCFRDPTYSRGFIDLSVCNTLFGQLHDCNDLHGPVHTAELWSSQDSGEIHTLLSYSEDGRLVKREERQNGVLKFRRQTAYVDARSIAVDETGWTENGQTHSEIVLTLNKQGNITNEKSRLAGGPFMVTAQREYDGAGREVSTTDCSMGGDGKSCRRTESEYDQQGRLMLTRTVQLPRAVVTSHVEYEYPAENSRRKLDYFGGCFDPTVPTSIPAYVVETKYDSAGRVIEETTSSPVLAWEVEHAGSDRVIMLPCSEGSPNLGHVVKHYDDSGHLVDQQSEVYGIAGVAAERESISYEYDRFGNELSEKRTTTRPDCGKNTCGEVESTDVREFSYEYDRFGNWTSKASYALDEHGHRGEPWLVYDQKLTYYPK